MTKPCDVVVLGSGNAGMAAAGAARAAGKSVAVIESRDVGGTCPIRGCVPKKVLVAAAQTLLFVIVVGLATVPFTIAHDKAEETLS